MPATKRPNLQRMAPQQVLDWLRERIGSAPYASLDGLDTDEAMATLELGLRRHAPAAALLVELLETHPDDRIRLNAADALLCFDDAKLLDRLIAQLDFDAWDGGLVTSYAVEAAFKRSPDKARSTLRPAFARAEADPANGHGVALAALQVLARSTSFSHDDAHYVESRNLCRDPLGADCRGWLDQCVALGPCAHRTNQRVPILLLHELGDERWLDTAFAGLEHNPIASTCQLLRSLDEPSAAPRLRTLARQHRGPDKKLLLEAADYLERPRRAARTAKKNAAKKKAAKKKAAKKKRTARRK